MCGGGSADEAEAGGSAEAHVLTGNGAEDRTGTGAEQIGLRGTRPVLDAVRFLQQGAALLHEPVALGGAEVMQEQHQTEEQNLSHGYSPG